MKLAINGMVLIMGLMFSFGCQKSEPIAPHIDKAEPRYQPNRPEKDLLEIYYKWRNNISHPVDIDEIIAYLGDHDACDKSDARWFYVWKSDSRRSLFVGVEAENKRVVTMSCPMTY